MERIGNVSDLVQKAQDACKRGDRANAKRFALEAIAGANIAKENFLTGVHSSGSVTDQQLADWYGGCSFVMNKVCFLRLFSHKFYLSGVSQFIIVCSVSGSC